MVASPDPATSVWVNSCNGNGKLQPRGPGMETRQLQGTGYRVQGTGYRVQVRGWRPGSAPASVWQESRRSVSAPGAAALYTCRSSAWPSEESPSLSRSSRSRSCAEIASLVDAAALGPTPAPTPIPALTPTPAGAPAAHGSAAPTSGTCVLAPGAHNGMQLSQWHSALHVRRGHRFLAVVHRSLRRSQLGPS